MLILPTLRQLKYFIALAETLSFSKAAENCFVTQSTLSASIKDLEDIIGQTLFERSSRQVLLTTEGHKLLKKSKTIIDDVQNMVLSASQSNKPLSGNLRLGIIPTIAPYTLPDIIKLLQNDYPELTLKIEENLTHIVLERLERGDIDLGLVAFPCNCSQFERMTIAQDELLLAINKENEKNYPAPTIQNLDEKKLLLLEDGHCLRDHIVESCHLNLQNTNKMLKASTLDTLLSMVSQGLGTTLVPKMAVDSGIFAHKNISFMSLSNKNSMPKRDIGLIWRKSSVQEADFQLLGGILSSMIGKQQKNAA